MSKEIEKKVIQENEENKVRYVEVTHRYDDEDEVEIDLGEMAKFIGVQKKAIAGITVACIVVAGAYLCFAPKVYESSMAVAFPINTANAGQAEYAINSIKDRLSNPDLLELDAKEYEAKVKVTPGKKTNVLNITVSDEDPKVAKEQCEKIIANYRKAKMDYDYPYLLRDIKIAEREYADAKTAWEARLAKGNLPDNVRCAEEEIYLNKTNNLITLKARKERFGDQMYEVITKANIPEEPAKPKKALTLLGATVGGLFVGLGYAVVKFLMQGNKQK